MIEKLNHVAIVVPDLSKAKSIYESALGAKVSDIKPLLEHGVSTMFVDLGSTRIELLHPLGDGSPISTFLEQNPNGSIHHLCFEVRSIKEAVKCLTAKGLRILGDGIPKIGAHGKLVVFLHPKDFLGTLIELEEI
tara:strand:- start:1746 stop:2150 length:405 start_codon:yes stop_codon:yes gene_type:complete